MKPCLLQNQSAARYPLMSYMKTTAAWRFHDINPQAPVHILIIPKEPLPGIQDVGEAERMCPCWVTCWSSPGQVAGCGRPDRIVDSGASSTRERTEDRQWTTCTSTCSGGRRLEWPPG